MKKENLYLQCKELYVYHTFLENKYADKQSSLQYSKLIRQYKYPHPVPFTPSLISALQPESILHNHGQVSHAR